MKKLAMLLMLAVFLIPAAALAGELASRGTAAREVIPDQLSVKILVQADADTQQEAAREAADLAATVEEAVKKLPLEEVTVQTAGLRVTPVYHYKKKSRSIVYYSASAAWSVRGEAVDEILDLVNTLGSRDYGERSFVRIDGMSWDLSPGLREETRKSLIAEAVRSARAKAQTALDALDLKPKKVVRIDLEDAAADKIQLGMDRKAAQPMAYAASMESSPEPAMMPQLHRGTIPMEIDATMVVEF